MLKQTYNEYLLLNHKWGCSSNGRALALHARGTGFDPLHLQIPLNIIFLVKFESTFDSVQHIFLVLFSHCYPVTKFRSSFDCFSSLTATLFPSFDYHEKLTLFMTDQCDDLWGCQKITPEKINDWVSQVSTRGLWSKRCDDCTRVKRQSMQCFKECTREERVSSWVLEFGRR